jgi:hypothetical protein
MLMIGAKRRNIANRPKRPHPMHQGFQAVTRSSLTRDFAISHLVRELYSWCIHHQMR